MDEEKLKSIIDAMNGLTYIEWRKLEHVINMKFSAEASRNTNKIMIASADEIVKDFKRLF